MNWSRGPILGPCGGEDGSRSGGEQTVSLPIVAGRTRLSGPIREAARALVGTLPGRRLAPPIGPDFRAGIGTTLGRFFGASERHSTRTIKVGLEPLSVARVLASNRVTMTASDLSSKSKVKRSFSLAEKVQRPELSRVAACRGFRSPFAQRELRRAIRFERVNPPDPAGRSGCVTKPLLLLTFADRV